MSPVACCRALLCALYLLPAWAAAQQPVLPRPPEIPDQPAPARPLDLTTPSRPPQPARAGVSVRVERFALSGNTVLNNDEIEAVLRPYTGRTLDFAQLSAAANAVTDLYRRRGYLLALAYLPEQAIRAGEVEIAVLEGRLGALAVDVSPVGRVDREFIARMTGYQLESGAVVQQSTLLRNLLVVNELPGLQINADVRPGSAVGTADVAVQVRESGAMQGGAIVLDNHGTKYSGRTRLGANLYALNLAGRGDQLIAQALLTDPLGQRSAQLGYSLPVHASGTRLSASLSSVDYRLVGSDFEPLGANGWANYLTLAVDQPLVRRPRYGLTMRAAYVNKQLRDRLDAVASVNGRHADILQWGVRGIVRDRSGPARGDQDGAATRYALTFIGGRLAFDDAAAEAADAAGRRTAGDFARVVFDLERVQPLATDWLLQSRLSVQTAVNRNLDPAEQSVLGGANAVRPYGELSTAVDESAQLSLDLRHRVRNAPIPLSFSLFADLAEGRLDGFPNPGTDGNRVHATLVGVGVQALLPSDITARWALTAQRVTPQFRSRGDTYHGWVEFIKSF